MTRSIPALTHTFSLERGIQHCHWIGLRKKNNVLQWIDGSTDLTYAPKLSKQDQPLKAGCVVAVTRNDDSSVLIQDVDHILLQPFEIVVRDCNLRCSMFCEYGELSFSKCSLLFNRKE